MSARFMLTFDCEGKWGVADCLGANEERLLTDARLEEAYRSILELLDEFSIKATFAFVGLFAQSAKHFILLRAQLESLSAQAPYLRLALNHAASKADGWHGDRLVEAAAAAEIRHEIALHGVTHVPWTTMDPSFAEAELKLFQQLDGQVRKSRTFVYPRNLVAHADLLKQFGIEAYRAAPPRRSRPMSLLSEFNLFQGAQPEPRSRHDGVIAIPAGYFLNTAGGLRRIVPIEVTELRAKRMLDRAQAGELLHFWLHPENVAMAPRTLDTLRRILRLVAERRDHGRCEVLTQMEYVERLRLDQPSPKSGAGEADFGAV